MNFNNSNWCPPTLVCKSIDNREGGGIGNTYIHIYGGGLTRSRDSIKVRESHSIDKQAKAALEKDLVPLQPRRQISKAKKMGERGNFSK